MRAERINIDQLNNEKRVSVNNIISRDCTFIVSPSYDMMLLSDRWSTAFNAMLVFFYIKLWSTALKKSYKLLHNDPSLFFLDLENSLKLANAHGNATVEEIRAALKKYWYRIKTFI
jgi:hypothetical protein